ncbi:protein of unknown function (DUF1814) [Candidatus Nitrososphaera evergladensis SR1]|uniref:Nucleotidyltransferase family protein n=1 Tax=Candidatus Nitrososphaera evergladensis SR1 TaxID=1459636 RepID=A0A075MM33_9ARCH|nr:nucleotidyltransferase family protein [Candidatus Nitrososphaera evergladensis]AIF82303.1 protein of unknown function (DUF1814) [Candidatus Nitrososphaera evergladensis SR1]
MLRDDLESRETEIIRILSSLPKGFFVVIGGYAVSALSIHRFSVDCDMVILRKDAMKFSDLLKKEGYRKEKSAKGFDEAHHSEVDIYVKSFGGMRVSVDLFINGITSRKTEAWWNYEYIKENSTEAIVVGTKNSASTTVPTKELLMVMKMHSARDVDMRDIVMLSEGVDWTAVLKHAMRRTKSILVKQVTEIIGRMEEEQFIQSLRAAFGLRRNIEPLISDCKKNLSKLRQKIESSSK